jgi:hypothetical protein
MSTSTKRVTETILQSRIDYLNAVTGMPLTTWGRVGSKNVAQIGNYHLSGAYGGWRLEQIASEGGSIRDVFRCGYVSKRELLALIDAMLVGITHREASNE